MKETGQSIKYLLFCDDTITILYVDFNARSWRKIF